jgi:pyruvate ferredoxin oxidoreductase alpha subunit
MSNAFATKGKAAVLRLRAGGMRIGLLRLRVLRPFPAAAVAAALQLRKAVAVIDQNLAPGLGGITYQEIAAALYDSPARPPPAEYRRGPWRQGHLRRRIRRHCS